MVDTMTSITHPTVSRSLVSDDEAWADELLRQAGKRSSYPIRPPPERAWTGSLTILVIALISFARWRITPRTPTHAPARRCRRRRAIRSSGDRATALNQSLNCPPRGVPRTATSLPSATWQTRTQVSRPAEMTYLPSGGEQHVGDAVQVARHVADELAGRGVEQVDLAGVGLAALRRRRPACRPGDRRPRSGRWRRTSATPGPPP